MQFASHVENQRRTDTIQISCDNNCITDCNNNCVYCFTPYDDLIRLPSKDTAEVKSEILLGRLEKLNHIAFNGGEPTIRYDILELLSYSNKLGYKIIEVETNGRMFCYRKFTKKFASTGCNIVNVSLHASYADLHDKITRTPDSFEQTVQGIKNLLEYRDKIKITVEVEIHRMNYINLPALARFISKEFKGIHRVIFFPVVMSGNAYIHRKLLLVRMTKIRPYLERALLITEKSGVEFHVCSIPLCVINRRYWEHSYYRKGEAVMTFEHCGGCIMKKSCVGILRSYSSLLGTNEFKPIKRLGT